MTRTESLEKRRTAREMRIQARLLLQQARSIERGIDPAYEAICKSIIHEVCSMYGVTRRQIESDDRSQHVSDARHIIVYLMRKLTPMSTPEIGRAIERDHSTILHAFARIRVRVNAYPTFASVMAQLIARIEAAVSQKEESTNV